MVVVVDMRKKHMILREGLVGSWKKKNKKDKKVEFVDFQECYLAAT